MPESRLEQLRWSRGWVRHCLAGRLGVSPEQVPLLAPPGQAPALAAGWGHVSFSHCCDALAIAWSDQPIGVDLERLDRRFPAKALAQRFFCQDDQDALRGLVGEPLRQAVLRQWVAKEAAIKWDRSSLARGTWSTGSARPWPWRRDIAFAASGFPCVSSSQARGVSALSDRWQDRARRSA